MVVSDCYGSEFDFAVDRFGSAVNSEVVFAVGEVGSSPCVSVSVEHYCVVYRLATGDMCYRIWILFIFDNDAF